MATSRGAAAVDIKYFRTYGPMSALRWRAAWSHVRVSFPIGPGHKFPGDFCNHQVSLLLPRCPYLHQSRLTKSTFTQLLHSPCAVCAGGISFNLLSCCRKYRPCLPFLLQHYLLHCKNIKSREKESCWKDVRPCFPSQIIFTHRLSGSAPA